MTTPMNTRQRLVFHVQELERCEQLKQQASDVLNEAFEAAHQAGYDKTTLKVVLKLRKMTPEQRRERRALEAIYMATLGMLEGDSLPDVARHRLDEPPEDRDRDAPNQPPLPNPDDLPADASPEETPTLLPPAQPTLALKTPNEARQEGNDAAAAGKRIYDNPYPAGDPCRAAWDEGWCAQQQSHGMETPAAYRRRGAKPPEKPKDDKPDNGDDDAREDAA